MARGVNLVIILGNCGSDPETRYMPSGGAVTNITIATSETWKDKQSGKQVEKTEWHRVVFFNKLAEIAGQYLHKGSKVYIEGSLRTRQYEKDGIKRYTTEIVASELQMLDSAQRSAAEPPGGPGGAETGRGSPSGQSRNEQPGFDDFDEDSIPF